MSWSRASIPQVQRWPLALRQSWSVSGASISSSRIFTPPISTVSPSTMRGVPVSSAAVAGPMIVSQNRSTPESDASSLATSQADGPLISRSVTPRAAFSILKICRRSRISIRRRSFASPPDDFRAKPLQPNSLGENRHGFFRPPDVNRGIERSIFLREGPLPKRLHIPRDCSSTL